MQASAQDLSVMLGSLIQAPISGIASPGVPQPVGNEGEPLGSDFLASLENSLQALSQGEQSPLVAFAPSQLLATVEQYLSGQTTLPGGNGLPLATGVATADGAAPTADLNGLTPELRDLIAQLQTLVDKGAPAAVDTAAPSPSQTQAPIDTLIMTPVAADGEAQAALDQRRLFERFQSLPEVRQVSGDLPAVALRQSLGRLGEQTSSRPPASSAESQPDEGWLGAMKSDLAMTPVVTGDGFAQQLSKMAAMKNITLSSAEGAALDTMVKADMPDAATLSSAVLQRQVSPALTSSDARPANPTFIPVPLNDPQWQSEFSNRVTWLARAGGNQSAEIRLNPDNMGPIEVRVVMKDDQASITFTAQHGVVRDAIEASLPRLREMFSGSGMQLANANVSDQPLQDQRQHQSQGFGSSGGRSQGGYRQDDELGDLISPLAMSHSSMVVDSLDLYA